MSRVPRPSSAEPRSRARSRRRPEPSPASLVTRRSLVASLRGLGVRRGSVILVHSSLSSMGFVCGGSVAVVQALLDAVGKRGTVAVPTHSSALSDPAGWRHPPVPRSWWPTIRREMPPFDRQLTPARAMGAIAETFRRLPRARRSDHPASSFAAVGPRSAYVTNGHPLSHPFGPRSPLGRLLRLDARVLLLGVGHGSNSSLHLAEALWGGLRERKQSAPCLVRGRRRWRRWSEPAHDEGDFARIGASFDATGAVRLARVGSAIARLMPLRDLVTHAVAWMRDHRRPAPGAAPEATSGRSTTRRGRTPPARPTRAPVSPGAPRTPRGRG